MSIRALLTIALFSRTLLAQEPPVISVGLDAYRQWDRWAYQRIGARAYMRSTYDRRGGNEGADASHFLYQLAENKNVTLDIEGPGILYFARYNHWHGSPWRYEVDGLECARPARKAGSSHAVLTGSPRVVCFENYATLFSFTVAHSSAGASLTVPRPRRCRKSSI